MLSKVSHLIATENATVYMLIETSMVCDTVEYCFSPMRTSYMVNVEENTSILQMLDLDWLAESKLG